MADEKTAHLISGIPQGLSRRDLLVASTALAASAPCIVTGDKDLLDMQQFQTIDIIRPREFASYEAIHLADTGGS